MAVPHTLSHYPIDKLLFIVADELKAKIQNSQRLDENILDIQNMVSGREIGSRDKQWNRELWHTKELFLKGDDDIIMKEGVLQELHDSPLAGGHLSYARTFDKVRRRYWWKGMAQDIQQYCKTCRECQEYRNRSNLNKGVPMSLPVASRPRQMIGVDYIGKLTRTKQGNEYILVFVDHFTKWPEAFATVSADAATTARIFIDFWICRHGIPDILISDRGSHFLNDLVEEVNKIFSIEHRLTTAYRPQTNGQVERFNRTLIDMLRIYADSHKQKWDIYLQPVLCAYRSSSNAVTRHTPFFLAHGTEMQLPGDRQFEREEERCGIEQQTKRWIQGLHESFKFVRMYLEKEKLHQEETERGRMKNPPSFHVGQQVWMYVNQITRNEDKEGRKFAARWQGPFVIIDKVNANLYQLENDRGFPLAQLIHVSRLKEYYPRTPEAAPEIAAGDTFDPSLEPKGTLDTKEERHQRWEEKQGRKRQNRKREIEKYEEVPSLTRNANGGIDPRDAEWQPPTTPEPTKPPETTRTTTQVAQSTRAAQSTHKEADSDADLPTTGADSTPTKAVTAPTTNTSRPTRKRHPPARLSDYKLYAVTPPAPKRLGVVEDDNFKKGRIICQRASSKNHRGTWFGT
ncbi:gag-pol fusion protein [Pelomyxa schiedti]|nr:gag-pol fusion protein [Pelomyxa schiedti]